MGCSVASSIRSLVCRESACAALAALLCDPAPCAAGTADPVRDGRGRPVIIVPARSAGPGGVPAGSCIAIREVRIEGVDLIDGDALRRSLEPLAARCIGNAEARALVGRVNDAHSERGFVTTQGYVPAQDIAATGLFRIEVVTGRVGRVVYRETRTDEAMSDAFGRIRDADGVFAAASGMLGVVDAVDNGLDRMKLLGAGRFGWLHAWLADPVDTADPVQIDRIQQGLDQLNRSPSSHAAARLVAGREPATSDIVIDNPVEDAFRLSAGVELNGASLNQAGTTTGKRIRIDAAKDGLIGIGDVWAASLAGGLDSNEINASLALPLRWLTLGASTGYSESLSPIGTAADLYSRTSSASVTATFVLMRRADLQVSLDGMASWRRNERWIESVELAPQTVFALRGGVTLAKTFGNQTLSVAIGVGEGLDALGATIDPASPDDTAPRAQFVKVDGSLGYALAVPDVGTLKVDLAGQWTDHPLYSDDGLTLGSATSVRGFTQAAATVDRGVVVRSEFGLSSPANWFTRPLDRGDAGHDTGSDRRSMPDSGALPRRFVAGAQPYLFADCGAGEDIANGLGIARAAVGAGFRYAFERLRFDVAIAQPIASTGPRSPPAMHPEIYLTLSIKAF